MAHGLTRRDKDGVFSENGGRDSSYNAVSILFGQTLALHLPIPEFEAALPKVVAWQITRIRASGEAAFGRMMQNEPYVGATLNPNLAVGALPAGTLDGVVDTFDATARVSLALDGGARVQGVYTRNVHDNRTSSLAYPAVSTDMFLGATPRSNQPFSFTRDRFKVTGDMPVPFARLSAGAEYDVRSRTLQEVVSTDEATVWARAALRPIAGVSVSAKLAHAQRKGDDYGVAPWITPPENPLLRKFNLADRRRDRGEVRADTAVADGVNVGLNLALSHDHYGESVIGLTDSRSQSGGVEVSAAISDDTQVSAFAQIERVRSNQAGSQVFGVPDWTGEQRDRIVAVGNAGRERVNEYGPTVDARRGGGGQAALYGRMLVQEIKPLIDSEFRTRRGQADTAVGGSSLGGLVTLYLGLNWPGTFGRLCVMSPSVWWDVCWVLREFENLVVRLPWRVWLDVGWREGTTTLTNARELRDVMLEKGWRLGDTLRYFEARTGEHSERAWSRRVSPMLQFLFPAPR